MTAVPVKTKSACESVFRLDREASLPDITIRIAKMKVPSKDERKSKKTKECTSKVFGPITRSSLPQPNLERLQKVLAEFPQRTKKAETCLTAGQWQTTFTMLTGFDVKIE